MTPKVSWAILAAAGLLAVAGRVSYAAEQAVGLEAQGVDPSVALQDSQGLDLRDELGRPVSRQLIATQLKAAQAAVAADAAFSSRLPQARSVARLLELWQGLGSSISALLPELPWRQVWALPGPKPVSCAAVILALMALLPFSCLSIARRSSLPSSFSGAPLALRC